MKKSVKRLIALILAVVVLASVAVIAVSAADSDPTVIFDAAKREFTFENVTYHEYEDGTYPDLFRDIKNAMPGDSFLQSINVKVVNAGSDTVKMYLRAENPNDDYVTLLSAPKVELTASFLNDSSKTTIIPTKLMSLLTGDAAEPTVYSGENVYLGAFSGSRKVRKIDVSFSMPIEAGNELANLYATVDWVFLAEIIPEPVDNGGRAKLNTVDHFAYIIGYPDGSIRPANPITRAEVATIFFRLLTDESRAQFWSKTNTFTDVPSTYWFNTAISTMQNAGIVKGYPDGSFRPNASITRAEFVTMATRFFEMIDYEKDAFNDIRHHWARDEINSAAAAGFINGYPDGSFRPDQAITRAEAMTIINRVIERNPHKDHLLEDMIKWPDNMDPEVWYYAQVQEATNSHHFHRIEESFEVWETLLPVRDWEAFEKEWSQVDSAPNPGEVVSSGGGYLEIPETDYSDGKQPTTGGQSSFVNNDIKSNAPGGKTNQDSFN